MTEKELNKVPTKGRRTSFMQRIRVPLGFVFAAAFVFFSQPTWTSVWPGISVAALGLLLRLWSTGYLRKHRELCVSGPYRWTRNPLYLGSFVMGVGFTFAAANPWILMLLLILFFTIYLPVMRKEETELAKAYGSPYEEYRNSVPAFFPTLSPYRELAGRNFSCKQIILNKEYKAVFGFLIVFVYLMIRLK